MTWTHQSVPGKEDTFVILDPSGDECAMFSVYPAKHRYSTDLIARAVAGINAPPVPAPVVPARHSKNQECIWRGWAGGLAEYEEARSFIREMLVGHPPKVAAAVDQAWKNGGYGDVVLTPDRMGEWYTEADRVIETYTAHAAAEDCEPA